MRTHGLTLVLAACLLLAACRAPAQPQWHPAQAPLMTRWARDVSPSRALPEYPRPQMTRREWQNLNGLWDYAITDMAAPQPAAYQGRILVPYPVESALSGVMKPVTEKNTLWYRRLFRLPAAWAGRRVLLHFGAVDWHARVYLNGKALGAHAGGYDAFSFDITPALKRSGAQELVVRVEDPTDRGGQPRGKQVLRPGGIFYTPTTGIWQTVWLEPVSAARIETLKLTPDVDRGVLRLSVETQGQAAGGVIEAVALDGAKPVARVRAQAGAGPATLALPVKNAKLWSSGRPFLYGLKVMLTRGGKAVDSVNSYFGMRKIALGKDERGITRLMLNGKFVFQVGFLDQGFWPDGLYTAPTDAALRYDIEMTKRLGMNMARKHVKVEPDRWYYWCDRLGLLVWQDMPSGDNRTPQDRAQFEKELAAMLRGMHNHPAIIMWVVFNEGWGQHDTERLTAWVKQQDPSRLVNNASGWTDRKAGDVIDMHNYPGPGSPQPEPTRAAVLGEFGGLGLGVDGHTWSKQFWGYQGMSSQQALTRRYVGLLRRAWQLKDDPGLCAAVYTQTTDVETECNGLMTYDRALLKVDLPQAAAANRGQFAAAPPVHALAATSQDSPQVWRYTFEAPGGNWFLADFDASSWQQGPGGFGTEGTPGAIVRTRWNTPDIWLRREFTLPDRLTGTPLLLMHHDEDAEVYINGVQAVRAGGFIGGYEEFEITPEAQRALKPGRNVLAVHCRQTAGGQYIDVGLIAAK